MKEQVEDILKPNPDRFVMYPIHYNDIWEFYKTHFATLWSAEEIDLAVVPIINIHVF